MNTGTDFFIFYLTRKGEDLAHRLALLYPEAPRARFDPELIASSWPQSRALIFIMAAGIVTRTLAPLLQSKEIDPALLVLDEAGSFAIPLAGGHLGGANALAREIAAFLGGQAVITTASDVHGLTPLDLWAREHNLVVENPAALPRVGIHLVNEGCLPVYTEEPLDLPAEYVAVGNPEAAEVIISCREMAQEKTGGASSPLFLRPRNLAVGIGCNRGTGVKEISEALADLLKRHGLSPLCLAVLGTAEAKSDEAGLIALASNLGLPLKTFTAAALNAVTGVTPSEAARQALGLRAVAEPAAILAAHGGELIVPKEKQGNVTLAIARISPLGCPGAPEDKNRGEATAAGHLYVVGTGPGGEEHLTRRARNVLLQAELVVGYPVYLELLGGLIKGKKTLSSGMTREKHRCQEAIAAARAGKTVALVSGGDPGIYALAGLVYELLREEGEAALPVSVEILPGVSAINASAARLGAPLMHDFAVISLSDRLTPWERIALRLDRAAAADFVIALLNPKSRGRPDLINRAAAIIQSHRPPTTPVGLVRGAFRENEEVTLTTLAAFLAHPIDMQTTVIIGNSQTFIWQGKMVTPRGYALERRP